MSRRRSTGDLVPKDVTEVLAREARVHRGHRKPGSSLGQALCWLKGNKRKKSIGNGFNQITGGVKDNKGGLCIHDTTKAGPKATEEQKRLSVHYSTTQHYQENVFIEGSRPQYLEDLHTEAQEGLKILQEEHNDEVSFHDDDSIVSNNTLHQQKDIVFKDEDDNPESRPYTGNTDTSALSAGSTRPGLTRQGSTFKPLNPVKSIDRNKKRSRRTTIMGIPSQVQKELALRRHSTFQQLPENTNTSNNQSGVVIIPTVDGGTPVANKEGARVHLSELEVSREEKLLQKHLQAMHQCEQHFSFQGFEHRMGPTTMLRPKSVAVPGLTSSLSSPATMFSLQEPQGPVMSISPQATYMSTIIPNAVLPAAVDVIEIDHSLIRTGASSVRTVSKSTLGSGDSTISPLLSRRSDMDSSQNDPSQNNSRLISDLTSNLSEPQSSNTIVLISSPASSKRSTCSADSQRLSVSGQGNQQDQTGEDLISIHSSVSMMSCPTSTCEHLVARDGSELDMSQAEDKNVKRRSLSVTKTKQPPAPPRRTNSLHCNKIRNGPKALVKCQETVLENVTMSMTDASKTTVTLATPNSVIDGETPPKTEASFLHRDKMERTISPSSGYSSQSGTPTLSPKEFCPTSPERQKKSPVKPERSVSRASTSAGSPSSSLTSLSSGASEPVSHDLSSKVSTCPAISSALSLEIKSLMNIPTHPKVQAPCPPPPDVWAHNKDTVELIFGSYGNAQLLQSLDGTVKLTATQTEDNELPEEERIEKDVVDGSEKNYDVDDTKMVLRKENDNSRELTTEQTRKQPHNLPVVTVTTEEQLVTKPVQEEPKTSESCTADTVLKENGHSPTDTLTIEVPKFPKDSPPVTPPPTYHPTPPLSRKPSNLILPSVELQKVQESKVSESCWPPPPPPLEEAYEAGEETDFPLPPPPPLPTDNPLDIPDKADKNVLTNLTEHVLPEQRQEAPSIPVSNHKIGLQKDSQSDILVSVSTIENTASILSNLSRQEYKAEDLIHAASPQTTENTPSVNFRRQPSTPNRAKEFNARHKSMPIPKEDANIPLVTPSLLQMVRLRSVSMAEGEGSDPSDEKSANVETLLQESCSTAFQTPQNIPQKPIRKSLTSKSSPPLPSPTAVQPSMRLQEAIRMKTAAMSTKETLLTRPVARLPPYNSIVESGSESHKSTASTASFIFSRSNKKVVIETVGPSPEAQITLKQNLAAELVHLSGQSKSNAYSNGGIRSVPPPVARKPSYDSMGPLQTPGNVGIKHQIAPLETKTTRVTADTIETLF
ncbi:hypothetical protein WMY93_019456 [Mugilogobius chulae]|uniref:KIAA1522 n=1 Tax=Mugilogobius chulae TaxID=88201 RepID=A0AAW0NFD7_9GOBI